MISRAIVTGTVLALMLCLGAGDIVADDARSSANIDDYIGGMAFLLDGEICLANLDGTEIHPLTHTDGKVNDFRFSPDLKYLALTKVVGMVEDVGLWEEGEEVPKTETWSIVVLSLATMKTVHEIQPEHDWLYLAKWSGSGRFLYYSSSGFDLSGYYQYDARMNSVAELDYQEGHKLLFADFSADGSRMAYVDDTGLGKNFREHLHILTFGTNEDRIVELRMRIANQRFSHDLRSVAFLDFQKLDSQSVSLVWAYDVEYDSLEQLASLPGKTRGNSSIAWSTTDSCLGLFHAPSQYPNGYIFALTDPSDVHILSGKQFSWAGDSAILYSRGACDLFLYDMKSREETLLIEKATHPFYLIVAD